MREVRRMTRSRIVRTAAVAVLVLCMATPALPAAAGIAMTRQRPAGAAAPQTFYVSTTGNDGNSGAGAASPVRTPAKAQQFVRAALPRHPARSRSALPPAATTWQQL